MNVQVNGTVTIFSSLPEISMMFTIPTETKVSIMVMILMKVTMKL
jgi:hypothetical protein